MINLKDHHELPGGFQIYWRCASVRGFEIDTQDVWTLDRQKLGVHLRLILVEIFSFRKSLTLPWLWWRSADWQSRQLSTLRRGWEDALHFLFRPFWNKICTKLNVFLGLGDRKKCCQRPCDWDWPRGLQFQFLNWIFGVLANRNRFWDEICLTQTSQVEKTLIGGLREKFPNTRWFQSTFYTDCVVNVVYANNELVSTNIVR